MKSTVSIRIASNLDAPFIRELIVNIWKNEYHFQIQKSDYLDLYHIDAHYPGYHHLFLIAENNQQLV